MFGIVIVNYNRGPLVKEISELYASYEIIQEVVVIDNNSTDDSTSVLSCIDNGKVHIITLHDNLGYARGNNVGLKYLFEKGYKYACIVNPDVYFEEIVLKRMLSTFEDKANSLYAVLTTSRCDPDDKTAALQYTIKAQDTFWMQFLSYSNIIRHYVLQPKYAVYNFDKDNHDVIEIAEAPGSFFGVRLKDIADIGYMDEGTFLYCEELLLHYRLAAKGYKIGFISDVKYEHRHKRYSTTTADKTLWSYSQMLKSKKYFQTQYLHLNRVQKSLLMMAEKYSIFEKKIIQNL